MPKSYPHKKQNITVVSDATPKYLIESAADPIQKIKNFFTALEDCVANLSEIQDTIESKTITNNEAKNSLGKIINDLTDLSNYQAHLPNWRLGYKFLKKQKPLTERHKNRFEEGLEKVSEHKDDLPYLFIFLNYNLAVAYQTLYKLTLNEKDHQLSGEKAYAARKFIMSAKVYFDPRNKLGAKFIKTFFDLKKLDEDLANIDLLLKENRQIYASINSAQAAIDKNTSLGKRKRSADSTDNTENQPPKKKAKHKSSDVFDQTDLFYNSGRLRRSQPLVNYTEPNSDLDLDSNPEQELVTTKKQAFLASSKTKLPNKSKHSSDNPENELAREIEKPKNLEASDRPRRNISKVNYAELNSPLFSNLDSRASERKSSPSLTTSSKFSFSNLLQVVNEATNSPEITNQEYKWENDEKSHTGENPANTSFALFNTKDLDALDALVKAAVDSIEETTLTN